MLKLNFVLKLTVHTYDECLTNLRKHCNVVGDVINESISQQPTHKQVALENPEYYHNQSYCRTCFNSTRLHSEEKNNYSDYLEATIYN